MALLRLTIRQLLLSAWRATTHEARDDDTKRVQQHTGDEVYDVIPLRTRR